MSQDDGMDGPELAMRQIGPRRRAEDWIDWKVRALRAEHSLAVVTAALEAERRRCDEKETIWHRDVRAVLQALLTGDWWAARRMDKGRDQNCRCYGRDQEASSDD